MEVERGEIVDTSRLYKILAMEWEGEELQKSEESAFRNIKKTLSKKFSFKKLKTATEKLLKYKSLHFLQRYFTN